MRVYATAENLNEWDQWETPLAEPQRLLRAASHRVDDALITALYSVDEDGYPLDPTIRQALRDATCAQAALWHRLGIDPDLGVAGLTRQARVTSKSIGSASLGYEVSERSETDLVAALTELCDLATTILRGALPSTRIGVTG